MNPALMADIPVYTAKELSDAIREVIHWRRNHPITREQRIAMDRAYIKLDQASANLDLVLKRVGK